MFIFGSDFVRHLRALPLFALGSCALPTEWHAAGPLAASQAGAELRMVDSDHFVQKDRPEEVVRAVRDVLERVKAR